MIDLPVSDKATQLSALIFITTVAQKTCLNSVFMDLCLNFCCAYIAPGQPPIRANMCNVLSFVRQLPF